MSQASPLTHLFNPPHAVLSLPAFAATAMGDPASGKALAPFLGPPTQKTADGRPRTPGHVHFVLTWNVIKPGFLGIAPKGYTDHTNQDHKRTRIPAKLIAMPTQWLSVILGNTAGDLRQRHLRPYIRRAALGFGRDLGADLKVVGMSYEGAKAAMAKYFADVKVPEDPIRSFWVAMNTGAVRRDLGGRQNRVDVGKIEVSLRRHLPAAYADQFMRLAPKGR